MKKKSILSLSILLMMSAFFIGCDVTSSQKEEENSLMTDDIREIVPENQVVVRDYTRVLNTDLLTKMYNSTIGRLTNTEFEEGDLGIIIADKIKDYNQWLSDVTKKIRKKVY